MLQALRDTAEYQWIVEVVLLGILLCLPTKDKLFSSNTIALATVVITGGIGYRYGVFILQTNPVIPLTPLQLWLKLHPQIMLLAWYLVFIAIDNMAMLAIYLAHKKYNLPNGYITKTILLAIFADALINLFRLTERYHWGTDYFKPLYLWGIPAINIGVLLVVFVVTIKTAWQHVHYKKHME